VDDRAAGGPERAYRAAAMTASRWARWGLRLLVSGGLLAVLLAVLPWEDVRAAAAQMTVPLYAGALAAFLGAHFLGR
jgi:hypothetical protein